ncbi:MAG: hypothetical protein JNL39_03065 [Opitutaceae bacterium]|nr:hypothetical protein [Opitutaceae bacterium]
MSLLRRVFPARGVAAFAPVLWGATALVLAVTALIVARACSYEVDTLAGYLGYLAAYVVLPGVVGLYFVNKGPLSLSLALALGVPTGFAVEIFSYVACSALGVRDAYLWAPLGWAGLAVAARWVNGQWPVRVRLTAHHAGLALGLAVAFLATALVAASQMFAEAPLADGLPTRAIFHDWVYLVSRAASIKHHWPLDDPSLAGTPLQYHYFMLVHAAASSATADVEITEVLLRLVAVPMGAVLVAQAFVLGRAVSHSPWTGVVAAILLMAASEVSFSPSYGSPMFLGLFVRWLFVSPTFFFGMIFCGALLIAVARCARLRRFDPGHVAWLVLLGATATGAKGTVTPVFVAALGLWAAWRWLREHRLPWRLVGFGVCLGLAFALVYLPAMSAWRTGDAAWKPFHIFEVTGFWKEHLPGWRQWLAQWLPIPAATPLASLACAVVIFAGTCGVRLLAIPYLLRRDDSDRDPMLAGWLGAFFVASAGMGLLMALNSHGELYLFLMARLPMSVLAAACIVRFARRVIGWRPRAGWRPAAAWRRIAGGGALAAFLVVLGVQTSLWGQRNLTGFRDWLRTSTNLKPDAYMRDLREAMLWVREHTEPDAVLVANAFTPENMKKDHWGALDRTLMGVHFYYSALSERRLWFEGPAYHLDTTRHRIRANLASNFFYRGRELSPRVVSGGPSYILRDRSLADGAQVPLPAGRLVFTNARLDVYRLSADGDGR